MSFGSLGRSVPDADTFTTIYTVSEDCVLAEITINVSNPNIAIATVDIAIGSHATPAADEYIAKANQLTAAGGLLEIAKQIVSPGELIVIRSDKDDTIFRVSGKELNHPH